MLDCAAIEGGAGSLILNANGKGLYRVKYPDAYLQRLITDLSRLNGTGGFAPPAPPPFPHPLLFHPLAHSAYISSESGRWDPSQSADLLIPDSLSKSDED